MNILQDSIPVVFTVGETVEWETYLDYYLPKDGWQLIYIFRNFDNSFEVTAKGKEDHYLVQLTSEVTSQYRPANYWWQARVVRDDKQHFVDNGELVIKANLALLDSYDGREHVQKTLDALEATILGKASRDQLSYSISGRSISRLSPSELLKWRDVYKGEYIRILKEQQIAKGLARNSLIKVRFSNS